MSDMMKFFDMGGYGLYVWPAYGTALVLIIALLLSSIRRARHLKHELASLEEKS